MKKLVLCAFLTLLSYNAKARCFDGNFDKEHTNCTIAEGIRAMDILPSGFAEYTAGYLSGVTDELMHTALLNQHNHINVFDCAEDYTPQLLHDILYDKVKKGDAKTKDPYHMSLSYVLRDRFIKCLVDKKIKNN